MVLLSSVSESAFVLTSGVRRMKDERKTKATLLQEIRELRSHVADLELRKAESESDEKFRTLAENSQDYIMRYDAECRHLYENPAALKVSGFKPEDIIGKTHREAGFDEDLCEMWEEQIKRVFQTGESNRLVFEWKRAEGNIHLDLRLFPEFDQAGQVRTVQGVSRDITKMKLAELQLAEQKDRLEALVAERTSEIRAHELSLQLEHRLLLNIVASENIEEALRMCLIELSEFCEYEYAEIWIPQDDTDTLKSHCQWSSVSSDMKQFAECSVGLTLEKGQDLAGTVWKSEELEWRFSDGWKSDLGDSRNKCFSQFGIKSLMGVPVKTKSALLAVFCFYSPNKKQQNKENIQLISAIALQTALAIDRMQVTFLNEHYIEAAPSAMLITSEDGTIIMQNRACSRLFGYTDSELLGRAVEVLIPEKHHKRHRELRDNVERYTLPRRMGSGLKVKGQGKDGTEMLLDVSLNVQKTVYGNRFLVGVIDLRELQRHINELNASRHRLRYLTNHMTDIAERERKSIARDLHDDLGQVLASLRIDVAILEHQVDASENTQNSESISENLTTMSDPLDRASERLHGFVNKLRPEILDNLGLITALEWQADEFFKSHRIKCEFICKLDRLTVNDEIATTIYRIVQECLTNISRHSKASNSEVQLVLNDNTLIIEVSDDGIGISKDIVASTHRFGLLGIRERISSLGGSVQIESTSGEGTTVRMTIPIQT